MAKRVILLTQPTQNRADVKGSLPLNEIWGKLLAIYMPSTDAEARRLWSKFSALRQDGRLMVEHVNECMTVRNQLMAVGETVPEIRFVDKLLNIDRELSYLRPTIPIYIQQSVNKLFLWHRLAYCHQLISDSHTFIDMFHHRPASLT